MGVYLLEQTKSETNILIQLTSDSRAPTRRRINLRSDKENINNPDSTIHSFTDVIILFEIEIAFR